MRLVQHDPAKCSLRLGNDRRIRVADQHVLKHRRVGDEDRRRIVTQRLPRALFRRGRIAQLVRGQRVRRFPVIQTEPDVAVERRRPRAQAFALTVDQCVQRVQKQGTHPGEAPAVGALVGELIEYRHEEALGLPRPGAARHQYRLGGRLAQQLPAAQLVFVRAQVAAEAVVGAVLGRAVHRPDELRRERAGLGELRHCFPREAPAERGLEDRIGEQGAVATRRRLEGIGQEAPELRRPHRQLAR